MTQYEFDHQLESLRRAQSEETAPIREEIDQLRQKQQYLRNEYQSLVIQMGGVKQRLIELQIQLKAVGGKYYAAKHQLILDNPKSSV